MPKNRGETSEGKEDTSVHWQRIVLYGQVVEGAVEVEKIENSVTFFANAFTELECDWAIVEVFEEENIVQ